MFALLISSLAKMASWLPLRLNQSLGGCIGRLAWLSNGRMRCITEENLRLCYPHKSEAERLELARLSLIETGKQLTECAWIWHRPLEQTERKIIDVRGQEHLDEARKGGKGYIMSTPHLGNWELSPLPLARERDFTYFYRSPRRVEMDRLLIKWRSRMGGRPVPLTAGGIRTGMKILKSGGVLGILPDQEPDMEGGLFAPFFNTPALTMTLLSKLANRSGANVIFCICERLPKGEGWRLHFVPAEPAVSSSNLAEATRALNRSVEQCIALCPAQYVWSYKRFNTLEDGSRRPYK